MYVLREHVSKSLCIYLCWYAVLIVVQYNRELKHVYKYMTSKFSKCNPLDLAFAIYLIWTIFSKKIKRPYDIFICIYFFQNEICDIAVFMSMAILASSFPSLVLFWAFWSRFSDPNHSLNRKRERFKVFEVEPGSNRDDIIINLIIN